MSEKDEAQAEIPQDVRLAMDYADSLRADHLSLEVWRKYTGWKLALRYFLAGLAKGREMERQRAAEIAENYKVPPCNVCGGSGRLTTPDITCQGCGGTGDRLLASPSRDIAAAIRSGK